MITREMIQEEMNNFWRDIEYLSNNRETGINAALDFFEIISNSKVENYFQKLPRRVSLEIADGIFFVFKHRYDFTLKCVHENLEKKFPSLSIEKKIAAALWLTGSNNMVPDLINTERNYDPEKITWAALAESVSGHSGSYPAAVK